MTMSSAAKTRALIPCPRSGPRSGIATIGRFADIVRKWHDGNRERRIGFKLDDRTIRDIGLTRLEVTYREAAMPSHKRGAHRWS
jgi:uncharacterized protein YjiS (DUF1127 family)